MKVLTGEAEMKCKHGGKIALRPSQTWVTIEGVPVLVEPDPLHRPIFKCLRATPTTPPCTLTISVDEAASYSALVTIDGQRVCKDTAAGLTNWSLLTTVPYEVTAPGQTLVDLGV